MRCRFMKCTEKKEDAETVIRLKSKGEFRGNNSEVLAEKGESGKLLIICRTRLIIAS